MDKKNATKIANKYFDGLDNRYFFEREVERIEEDENNFKFYFKRKEPIKVKGKFGVIWVNKKTKKAEWIPGK